MRMLKTIGRITTVMVLASLAGAGCVSYVGLTPLAPDHGLTVSSLQPTLSWKPASGDDVTYDVTINSLAAAGGRVYYREGLSGTSHVVEVPLDPDQNYTWSVRPRRDGEAGEWTRRKVTVRTIVYDRWRMEPMTLRTPKAPE